MFGPRLNEADRRREDYRQGRSTAPKLRYRLHSRIAAEGVSMRFGLVALVAINIAGCASNSGVAPMGAEVFMVSRQAATGFSGSGTLKAEALNEAGQYCAGLSKVIFVTSTEEAQPPYVLGNFPKAEVQFMCLSANDPRLVTSRRS
jgi:hypothetical protein